MKKIFIADDDKDLVEIITYRLKQEGFEVDFALTGEEVIPKVQQMLPDLLILDIMLPGIDGVTLSNKLKENEKTKNIPIIVLTGKIGVKDLFMTEKQLTVSAYFQKPVLLSTLVTKIKELLNV
jgi:DNA-binding response OmpR family regulator